MARSSFGDAKTKEREERLFPGPPAPSSSRRKSREEQKKENLRLYQSVWLQQSSIPFVKKATSYDIVRQVGKGTFSSVFFVRHRSYPDGVAMKVIDKERVTDASDVRKVLRNVRRVNSEVTLLKECDHDGICTVFDAFQTQKHVFIFMDFVERDLFDLLSGFPDGLPEKLAKSMNNSLLLHSIASPPAKWIHNTCYRDFVLLSKMCTQK